MFENEELKNKINKIKEEALSMIIVPGDSFRSPFKEKKNHLLTMNVSLVEKLKTLTTEKIAKTLYDLEPSAILMN